MTDLSGVDPYAQFINPPPQSIAPPQPAQPPIGARIINAESGGNPNARNPNSSAGGLGQFTDSTWQDVLNRNRPDLTYGKTPEQISALKADPKLNAAMTNVYAAENSESLNKAGLGTNPGNVYLAHFAGADGATKLLKSDPNTPVSQILSPDAIRSNPQIANMTAGQIQQWAKGKVGDTTAPEGYYGGQMHLTINRPSPADPYAQFVGGGTPSGGGVATQFLGGLAEGAENLPGTIPRIAALAGRGIDYLSGNQDAQAEDAKRAALASSIQQNMPSIGHVLPQPTTGPEGYARTIGNFIPGAAASTGGLSRIITQGVAPAVASETAGQELSGTPYEGAGRVGGAVLAGLRGGAEAPAAAEAAIPTTEQLLSRGGAQIKSANGGVPYHPEEMGGLVSGIENTLKSQNSRDYMAPQTFRAIQELHQENSAAGVQNVRSLLGTIADGGGKQEGRAAKIAQGEIDKFLEKTNPEAAQNLKSGRENYAAGKRSEKIDTLKEIAGLRAGRAGYGGNTVNAMRQVLYPILDKAVKGKTQGFSPEEISAMREIVEGTHTTNALRGGGMLSPEKGILGFAVGLREATELLGPKAAVVAPVLGFAANKLATIMTSRQIDRLSELVQKRSPLYREAVTKSANDYAKSMENFRENPTHDSFIKFAVASRNLSNGFRKDGINLPSGDLMRQFNGAVPAAADQQQPQ